MRLPKITFLCLITFLPIIQPFSVLTRRFQIARWFDLNSAVAFNILACVLGWLTLVGLAACSSPWADLQPLPPLTSTDYHLGPGDQIRIITFGDQQMSGEFRVNDSGNIAIPLLGNVQAASSYAQKSSRIPLRLGSKLASFPQP